MRVMAAMCHAADIEEKVKGLIDAKIGQGVSSAYQAATIGCDVARDLMQQEESIKPRPGLPVNKALFRVIARAIHSKMRSQAFSNRLSGRVLFNLMIDLALAHLNQDPIKARGEPLSAENTQKLLQNREWLTNAIGRANAID